MGKHHSTPHYTACMFSCTALYFYNNSLYKHACQYFGLQFQDKTYFCEKGFGGIKVTFPVFLEDSNYFLVHEQLLLTLTSVIAISTTLPTTIKASKVFHASVK